MHRLTTRKLCKICVDFFCNLYLLFFFLFPLWCVSLKMTPWRLYHDQCSSGGASAPLHLLSPAFCKWCDELFGKRQWLVLVPTWPVAIYSVRLDYLLCLDCHCSNLDDKWHEIMHPVEGVTSSVSDLASVCTARVHSNTRFYAQREHYFTMLIAKIT